MSTINALTEGTIPPMRSMLHCSSEAAACEPAFRLPVAVLPGKEYNGTLNTIIVTK